MALGGVAVDALRLTDSVALASQRAAGAQKFHQRHQQAQLKLEATSHAINTLKQLQQQNDVRRAVGIDLTTQAIEAQIKTAADQLQEARQAAASKPKTTALQLSMAKMKW